MKAALRRTAGAPATTTAPVAGLRAPGRRNGGRSLTDEAYAQLEELIVTDTIPLRSDAKDCDKVNVVSIAPLLGEAIRRINNEESVSSLFV